jgi:hypothetical protein
LFAPVPDNKKAMLYLKATLLSYFSAYEEGHEFCTTFISKKWSEG